MKYILSAFILWTGLSGNSQTFEESFHSAFLQSIKGLEALKGAQAGSTWVCTTAFTDFETSSILLDPAKELYALELTHYYKDPGEAQEALAHWEAVIEKALPAGDYKKSKTYDADVFAYMKTVFEFNSGDFALVRKRPSVYLGIYEFSGSFALRISLYEPFFKNQYQPKW